MEHGGDLDRAMRLYGGAPEAWLDLSTGINRITYPVGALRPEAWTALPTRASMNGLIAAASAYYGAGAAITPLAGAQSAIQLLPSLRAPGLMKIIGPTYNEYANVFTLAGWAVEVVDLPEQLAGADIAIAVNPNNPDGRLWSASTLLPLRETVGLLVVDESFMDMDPAESLAAQSGLERLIVLKSFGKFYGLAGLRLGFVLSSPEICAQLAQAAGPWPIAGPAIEIATKALQDEAWQLQTRAALRTLARDLDALVPWPLVGGTDLFRLYLTPDAQAAQEHLARHQIWTRRFSWHPQLLRIGVPTRAELERLRAFLAV